MSGILAAAIAGAVGGAGAGASDVGKDMMLQDNLKLKADLDQQREVRLQEMRNSSAADVANIHGDTARDVADTGAAASGYAAETAAGAHVEGAEIAERASNTNTETSARAHVQGSQIMANAHLQGVREAAKGLQTDDQGQVFRVVNGKAEYVTDEDGDIVKSSKDLTPATKARVDSLTKQLIELNRDVNDPQKGILIRSDPKQLQSYEQKMKVLQDQIDATLGFDSSTLVNPSKARPAGASSASRPPLSTFYSNR